MSTTVSYWPPARYLLTSLLPRLGGGMERVAGRARITTSRGNAVAAAFAAAINDPAAATVRAAYSRLQAETDELYARITGEAATGGLAVRVEYRDHDPYHDADELLDELRSGTIGVGPMRQPHPLLGTGRGSPYDRFRVVHDVLGHAALGAGFDRHGEYATWLIQRRLHSPAAAAALATELHGENCVLWVTGRPAAHKAALIDLPDARPFW